ncbi:heterokaryon incompatibility protein-domain-containing protein, partial [Podospora aff. communis PSN243]
MSPASRWHHRCCRPNVVLAGQMPFCKSCTEIHGSQELLDLRLPDRPAIPVYDELQLSWPSAIVPALRKDDTLGKNDTRVPTTNSRGQLDTTADSSLPNTPPPTIRCPFYDYDDLRFRDVIRVLELSRGAPGDPLHGQLTTFLIRDDAKYEALSYTWGNYDSLDPGDADCSRPCLIYLGDFWDPFPITSNCYYALRRLRSRGQPRRLWVDSICINQWNVEERGHQVDLMDGVFAKASSVIVYLGNESPDSSLALALLQQPERMDDVTEDEKSSLDSLFRRPYFSRMWIVQEVALAKSLHFYCGPSEAIFSPENWVRCPIINPWKNKSAAPWLKYSMQSFREIRDRVSILNFLEDTGNCQCSDPRDRIFALFGLINIPHSPKLDANYSLSTEQVFTGIAAFAGLVDQESFRRIAKLASRSQHSQSLPSWVPDW